MNAQYICHMVTYPITRTELKTNQQIEQMQLEMLETLAVRSKIVEIHKAVQRSPRGRNPSEAAAASQFGHTFLRIGDVRT